MTGYLAVPTGQSPERWVGKALDHVAALPPKKTRKK
jgi:hypothetical protein